MGVLPVRPLILYHGVGQDIFDGERKILKILEIPEHPTLCSLEEKRNRALFHNLKFLGHETLQNYVLDPLDLGWKGSKDVRVEIFGRL
jgi:hypothetical protein